MKNLHRQLFLVITSIFLAYVLVFALFQRGREQAYKQELAGVRVTIIDTTGQVVMDTEQDIRLLPNHLNRPEVEQSLREGFGYDIRRTSETNGETYFYSATYFPETGQIIRSALPYPSEENHTRPQTLLYIVVCLVVFLLLSLVLYFYTRKVGSQVEQTIDDYRQQIRSAEEDKLRLKHQLTQNTAHELKTPTASIQAYLETTLAHPDLSANEQRHFIERAYAQAKRMSALLHDMSTLTTLDQATMARPKTPVDMASMLREIAEDTRTAFAEKGIVLQLDTPDSLVVEGEQALLYSMVRNVVDNALLYASGATLFRISATLSPSPNRDGESVILRFTDNGIGVPESHLPHLFERFYRVDKGRSRSLGGTGLGLAIVRNIATQYGGGASAEATPNGGLTIQVWLNRLEFYT